ncbi:MAG: valine--tRNA ligase [Myxococcota bacterium]
MSASKMPPTYSPIETEERWSRFWEEGEFFTASVAHDDVRPTYTLVMPPPNVTGTLHIGHACRTTFEDVLVRRKRMQGFNTLWVPGTDHAGIATQVVVERQLKREGLTRHDLGRERFIKRIWEWKEQSGGAILKQIQRLGGSCDRSRERFTMEPDLSYAVQEAFIRLYNEGLIYRDTRLVNWDVESRTVLSDLEVETEQQVSGELFDFAYPIEGEEGELVVSTTRPETMLGDTAVAIHPEDPRYLHLHGKYVRHPFLDRSIPIVTDAILVDPEFGTGAVKVTPAHDWNDFETGKRHGLPQINLLNPDGTLNEEAGEFQGMDRFEARKAVKARLEAIGLARGSTKHMMTLPRSQRSGTIVEPIISTQWFVRMEPLAAPAIEAVENGTIQIVPEDWQKTYFHWMRNIHNWCISRQLWWGHPIPAWYCKKCEQVHVAASPPQTCTACGNDEFVQDEDVLDTWFSSALWPFSTLGWPNTESRELKRFYPTADLETGYDILFFWVARMIMMGLHFTGQVPFKRVLLAGLVTDERGEKMSKVKGNVIDPIDVIQGASIESILAKAKQAGAKDSALKYLKKTYPDGLATHGADALRMALMSYAPGSRRIALSIKRIETYRNFTNKLWNASRFSLMNLEGTGTQSTGSPPVNPEVLVNRWILARLATVIEGVTQGLDEYRGDEASSAVYHFLWDEFCDWYLELTKPLLASDRREIAVETRQTLMHVLETTLRLLHPMMPFITEEIWQRIDKTEAPTSICLAPYPVAAVEGRADPEAVREMEHLKSFVVKTRTIRAEHDLPNSRSIDVYWHTPEAQVARVLEEQQALIERLTGATIHRVKTPEELQHHTAAATFVLEPLRGVVPDVVDSERERERLGRELKRVEKDLAIVSKKLGNPSFIDRAPAEVVQKERTRLATLTEQRAKLSSAIAALPA